MNLSHTKSASTLPWPPEFAENKSDIETQWKVANLRLHKQLSGKSGAKVYFVYIESRASIKYSGFGILKLEQRHEWNHVSESQHLERARANSGDYADRHLPRILYDYSNEIATACMYSIAADGLEYVFPLARLDGNSDMLVRTVAAGLMEWNAIGHSTASDATTAQNLLRKWLGYRIYRDQGGHLPGFLEQCSAGEPDEAFSAAGTVYPNPLAFCLKDHDASENDLPIYPLLGQQHGDCHGNNILIRQEHHNAEPNYYLIDFALYDERAPIFYDHAYLELSLLLENAGMGDDRRWDALLTMCGKRVIEADKTFLRPEDKELTVICRGLRTTVERWIENKYRAIKSSAESQQQLARVAAGLNFANKSGLPLGRRYKALLYAAHQLKEYFRFKNMNLPVGGAALVDPEIASLPEPVGGASDAWREVWQQCSEFRAEHVYVLVAGAGLSAKTQDLAVLGRLPWAMVLDLNPESRSCGLLAVAESEIKKKRGFHLLTPEQEVDVNFDQGTLWLMAGGSADRPDTLVRDFDAWRFGTIRQISRILDGLRKDIRPRQLRAVFLPTHESERRYFELIADRIQEVFYGSKPKLIFCRRPTLHPFSNSEHCADIECEPGLWMHGMQRYLGKMEANNSVYLPKRVDGSSTSEIVREQHGFSPDVDLLNICEDLEIIHPGLEGEIVPDAVGDFLRGNTITWMELGRGYDVRLDMYPDFKRDVVTKLESYSNETVELSHAPGAGGTTIGRRLAWDLHMEFPCAVLRKQSDATAGRIASLYRLTGLPVLLLIEADTLTIADRERLYKAVRNGNARAVFVYVVRAYGKVKTRHGVAPPLSLRESAYFLQKYKRPDEDRMKNLERLANRPEMMPYRMPFFFGLFAFEEKFTHVNAYVRSHLQGLSDQANMLLRYVALVSKFSQSAIDHVVIAALAGRGDRDAFSLETVLGPSADRLVVQDNRSGRIVVRIVHPLIAEEILCQTGPNAGVENDNWKRQLEQLCCTFITDLAQACGNDSEEALHLLQKVFIRREPWSDIKDAKRHNFSQLIQTIPSDSGQAHVLKTLTENFPGEAHFWNHRGRHSNIVMRESCEKSEKFLEIAIGLAPNDPLHHHSLGMIYRFEVERLLKGKLRGSRHLTVEPDEAYGEIAAIFKLADASFAAVRKLDPDNEYGYVANIQLILFTIERIYQISGEGSYGNFFRKDTKVMAWLRSMLEKVKELLDEIIHLQGRGKSQHVTICAEKYQGLMGDYDAMISGLTKMLARADDEKSSLRRLITDCICSHHGSDWSRLTEKNLRRIHDLARDNIDSGTANRRDFLNWLQAYRRLPGFDFNEAIGTMDLWAANGDPIDAHYYLFVLHFLKWYRGLTTTLSNTRRHLTITAKAAGARDWSYEWMARPEARNCGLAHQSELGSWERGADGLQFYTNVEPLLRVGGVITYIQSARAGKITIYPSGASHGGKVEKIEAHFVPGTDFISGRDENTPITAYVGFGYTGLSAWIPRRI